MVVSSCLRDGFVDQSKNLYRGDGRKVDVTLSYFSSSNFIKTKALSDDAERQVNDLFIMAFPVSKIDSEGNPVFTGGPAVKAYFTKEMLQGADAQAGHYNAGTITLENVPTGSYVIEAVANVASSEYENNHLLEELNSVTTWESFLSIKPSLSTLGSVDRVSPSLLMSGTYRPEAYQDDHKKYNPIEITNGCFLSGYIHLLRVDARVKVVIKKDDAAQRWLRFEIEDWQICNVPDNVDLCQSQASTPSSITNSVVKSQFSVTGDTYSFEFYVPEYCFTSSDSSLDMIKKRERRNSEDTEWEFAPQDAPYFVINGKMEMLVDDAESGEKDVKRYADVKYIVHLGTCNGSTESEKAKDFNTERNTKYTYTLTVKGVDDIVVEAKKEGGIEYNHGVEGVVIDNAGGLTLNFDSHYGVANIALSYNDLKKMSIKLSSIVGEQEYSRDNVGTLQTNSLNVHSEDFQAFRFAFESNSSELAYKSYPAQIFTKNLVSYSNTYDAGHYLEVLHNEKAQVKDGTHIYAMYDLLSMLETLPFGNVVGDNLPTVGPNSDERLIAHIAQAEQYRLDNPGEIQYESWKDIPIIFTVFVNENVYYKDVEDWHKHAKHENPVPDRLLRMFTGSALSEDKKSEYIRGRYNFDQKPCQTYYSDKNNEALCVEYVNEHHHKDLKNTKGSNTAAGGAENTGWITVNNELRNKLWDDCADQSTPLCSHYNTFTTLAVADDVYAKAIPGNTDGRDFEAVYATLSRNRDLNRDGVIQSNELKWFLPSMKQYIQIIIGGAALSSKLFTPDDYNNWNEAVDGPKGNIFGNVRFHFIGVEKTSRIWGEEGYTVGNQSVQNPAHNNNPGTGNPWEIRCVRMLVDHSRVDEEESHWPDFEDLYYTSSTNSNVICMDRYQRSLHRQAVSGWIDLHQNSDDVSNSTFTYFQYAKNDSPLMDRDAGERVLFDRMHTNAYCSLYSEEPDGSDLGTWRMPNQRETAVMRYLIGISSGTRPNTGYYLSCSVWPFPSSGPYTRDGFVEDVDICTIGDNPTKSSPRDHLRSMIMRVRCVRDTDVDGNFAGSNEFGNPANFQAGDFSCTYSLDQGNFTVNASMDPAAEVVGVTIDGYPATTSSTAVPGTFESVVNGADITKTEVTVVWTIRFAGKILTYRKSYTLPARYWLISRYGVDSRYAYEDGATSRTAIGATDNRHVDDIESQYKWVITTDPNGGNPVNVSELVPNTTYYLFNAAYKNYITGPNRDGSYMEAGSNAWSFVLQTRSESKWDGYYVLRFGNSRNANSNGGVGNFGFWNGVDDGSLYKLTPTVVRGELPLLFTFDQNIGIEEISGSRNRYTVHVETSPEAVIESVTIGDYTATVTGSNGDYTATIEANIIKSHTVTTEWQLTFGGESFTRSHQYNLPTPYYVISNVTYPHRYAWSDYSNDCRTTVDPSDILANPDNLETKYKWIVTTTPVAVGEPENVSNFVSGTTYYLYNVAARKYVSGPRRAEIYLEFGDYSQALPCNMEVRDNGASYSVHFIGSGAYHANACIGAYNRTGTNPNYGCFGMFDTSNRDNAIAKYVFTPAFERGIESFGVSLGSEIGTDLGYKYVILDLATVDGVSSVTATINGVNANVALNGTRAIAFNDELEKDRAEVVWDVVYRGSVFQYTKVYVKVNGYWTFTHGDHYDWYVVPVASGNAYITNIVQRSSMPEDAKWILALKSNPTTCITQWRANETEEYVLYNLSVGQYLSAPLSGNLDMALTGSVNNAVVFVIKYGGDGVRPCLHFKNADGSGWIGWADYSDSNGAKHVGTNSGLRHAWHLDYHAE